MQFFDQLTVSMGQNVRFNVKHVYKGDDQLTAAANWHLGRINFAYRLTLCRNEKTQSEMQGFIKSLNGYICLLNLIDKVNQFPLQNLKRCKFHSLEAAVSLNSPKKEKK